MQVSMKECDPGTVLLGKVVRSWHVSDNTQRAIVFGHSYRPIVINFQDGTHVSATLVEKLHTN